MKLMTEEEGQRWLESVSINNYRDRKFCLPDPITAYRLDKDSGAKTSLARLLIYEIFADKPVVMVLGETGIWPSSENEFLFIKYREAVACGQNINREPFDNYPFHIAEAEDAQAMEGLIALCLYFIWDATVFDRAGETFVKISHDEWMDIGSNNATEYERVVKALDDFGLERL